MPIAYNVTTTQPIAERTHQAAVPGGTATIFERQSGVTWLVDMGRGGFAQVKIHGRASSVDDADARIGLVLEHMRVCLELASATTIPIAMTWIEFPGGKVEALDVKRAGRDLLDQHIASLVAAAHEGKPLSAVVTSAEPLTHTTAPLCPEFQCMQPRDHEGPHDPPGGTL